MTTTKRFLWLDVETTGLSAFDDLLLEVAMWPSRSENPFDLDPDDKFQVVVHHGGDELGRHLSAVTWKMHGASGLLAEVVESKASLGEAETRMLSRLRSAESSTADRVVWSLAGNSIHFDAGFLKRHLPAFAGKLSHRILDVSSLLLLAKSPVFGAPDKKSEPAHRAMADVEMSVRLAKECAILFGARGNL